jgi:hypothetical protein
MVVNSTARPPNEKASGRPDAKHNIRHPNMIGIAIEALIIPVSSRILS